MALCFSWLHLLGCINKIPPFSTRSSESFPSTHRFKYENPDQPTGPTHMWRHDWADEMGLGETRPEPCKEFASCAATERHGHLGDTGGGSKFQRSSNGGVFFRWGGDGRNEGRIFWDVFLKNDSKKCVGILIEYLENIVVIQSDAAMPFRKKGEKWKEIELDSGGEFVMTLPPINI